MDHLFDMSVPLEKSIQRDAAAASIRFNFATPTFKADPIETLSAEGLEACQMIDGRALTFAAKLLEELQPLPEAKPEKAVKSIE